MAYTGPIWEGVYRSFDEVPAVGKGFDGEDWINNSLKKMKAVRKEIQEGSIIPPASNYRECLLPLLAALEYDESGGVRILDVGGGIGFAYYQTVCGLSRTKGVEYHIVERESVCQAGRELFGTANSNPHYFTELPQTPGMYDIIHLGSVIHYVAEWEQLLSRVCALSSRYLLLVDVTAGNIPTFATSQHYYGSTIPVWFFNIEDILQIVSSFGYELIFKSAYQPSILGTVQELPMDNFDNTYRLKRTCNLLFKLFVSSTTCRGNKSG